MVVQPREARSESGVARGGSAGSLLRVGPPAPKLQIAAPEQGRGSFCPTSTSLQLWEVWGRHSWDGGFCMQDIRAEAVPWVSSRTDILLFC